ncbi:DALR anticodon-binding domain-containing protein, partial [Vallitalea maricola]|uniref:DALR anticodon-binding domain-containing protein n=1 Tax=Vallitalea maricola TaxID=3074433 RepID=UPI0030DDD5E3
MRKAEYDSKGESINYDLLTDDLAFNVVKTLKRFQGVVVDAAEKLEPSFISRYVVDLAQEFNRFYHN